MTGSVGDDPAAAVKRAFAKLEEQQRKVDGLAETSPWRATEIAILFAMKATAMSLHAGFIERHGISADPRDGAETPILFKAYARSLDD